MSQGGSLGSGGSPLPNLELLSGNLGGAVGPDALFNINLLGGNSILATGAPGANSITFSVTGTTNMALQLGNALGSLSSMANLTNGQLPIGSTGFAPTPATLTAGAGIAIVNGAGSITISATHTAFPWSNVGASGNLVVNTGIICNAGAALTFALPAVSAVGDIIEVVLDGSTSWAITQGAGQQIRLGAVATTLGAGGSLTTTARGDSIRMVCRTANTLWTIISVIGNITIV